jgi:hypothetical protein
LIERCWNRPKLIYDKFCQYVELNLFRTCFIEQLNRIEIKFVESPFV